MKSQLRGSPWCHLYILANYDVAVDILKHRIGNQGQIQGGGGGGGGGGGVGLGVCLSIIIRSLIIQILIKPPYKHLSKVLSVDLC